METLYALAHNFEELFDSYDAIYDIEYASDGKGGFIDDGGNPIDPAAVREEMQQAWFDTLDAMECEIIDKAENTAIYIKNLKADIEALKAEKKRLDARLKSKENKRDRMLNYLMCCMEAAKLDKIDTSKVYVKIKDSGRDSTVINDTAAFIRWAEDNGYDNLLNYSAPTIRKDDVKKAIKGGMDIPYVELTRSKSITIK